MIFLLIPWRPALSANTWITFIWSQKIQKSSLTPPLSWVAWDSTAHLPTSYNGSSWGSRSNVTLSNTQLPRSYPAVQTMAALFFLFTVMSKGSLVSPHDHQLALTLPSSTGSYWNLSKSCTVLWKLETLTRQRYSTTAICWSEFCLEKATCF